MIFLLVQLAFFKSARACIPNSWVSDYFCMPVIYFWSCVLSPFERKNVTFKQKFETTVVKLTIKVFCTVALFICSNFSCITRMDFLFAAIFFISQHFFFLFLFAATFFTCSNFFFLICSNFFICTNLFKWAADFLFAAAFFYLYSVQCLICNWPFLCSDPCWQPHFFKAKLWFLGQVLHTRSLFNLDIYTPEW